MLEDFFLFFVRCSFAFCVNFHIVLKKVHYCFQTGPKQPAVFLNGGGNVRPVPPVVIHHKPVPVPSPQYQPTNTQYATPLSSISPSTNTADSGLFVWQHVPSPAPKPAKTFTHDTTYVPPPFRLDLNPQFVGHNQQQQQPYYQVPNQHSLHIYSVTFNPIQYMFILFILKFSIFSFSRQKLITCQH